MTAALLVSIITNLMATFAASAINLAIPAISTEFQSGANWTGWIITGYLLGNVALLVPSGRIADKTGRKRIFCTGILVFTLSAFACSLADSIVFLLVCRIAQGIGGSMVFSTNMAIMVQSYPPQQRGKALGLAVAATYIGLSIGPPVGGVLNKLFGWRSIFIITSIVGLFTLALAFLKLKDDSRKPEDKNFDAPGNLIYIAAITLITCGISLWSTDWRARIFIPIALVLCVILVLHELKYPSPVLNIRLLAGNRNYAFSNLAALFNYCFTAGIGYYMSIYLQVVKDYDSVISGAIMIGQPVFQAIVSPFAGRLSDKISPFKVASAGMAACAVGLFFLCFINIETPLFYIIASLGFIGTGFGFFSSPNTNAIMSCVKREEFASANSFLATMRTLGQTTSISIVTSIMASHIGETVITLAEEEDIVDSIRAGFILFTVLCVIGVFLSMQRKSVKREEAGSL